MSNTAFASPAPSSIMGLTHPQFILSMAYGAAGWFAAVLLCRTLGPMGAFDDMNMVILYAAIIPGTAVYMWLGAKMIGLARNQVFVAFVAADMTALLLDGNAIAWFPSLYGATMDLVASSAAAILYGAGVVLVLAFVMNGRSEA